MLAYTTLILSLSFLAGMASSQQSLGFNPGLVSNCSATEIQAIEDRRKSCVARKEAQFEQSGAEKTQGVLCSFIEEVVEDCSKEFKTCYSPVQMKLFKATQLKIFQTIVDTYEKKNLELTVCSTYQKYMKADGLNGKCNPEEIEGLTKKYSACMDKQSKIQDQFNDLDSNISKIFCNIKKIIGECGNILKECFLEEKVEETNLEQIKTIQQITQKIGMNANVSCEEKESGAGKHSSVLLLSLLAPLLFLVNH